MLIKTKCGSAVVPMAQILFSPTQTPVWGDVEALIPNLLQRAMMVFSSSHTYQRMLYKRSNINTFSSTAFQQFQHQNQGRPSWSCSDWGLGSRPADLAHERWWDHLGWSGEHQLQAAGGGLIQQLGRVFDESQLYKLEGADTTGEHEPDQKYASSHRPAVAAEPPGRRQGPDGPPQQLVCYSSSGTWTTHETGQCITTDVTITARNNNFSFLNALVLIKEKKIILSITDKTDYPSNFLHIGF